MSKYIVRYGTLRSIGVMAARPGDEYRRSMEVVVRTERGLEVGQVLCEATDDALSHLDQPAHGTVVRAVSDEDAAEIDALDTARADNIATCQKHAEKLGLAMKLVDVEQLLGRQRMIVYFLSEDRVDFRQLVKALASEFLTRIEMKQIGVRDEAKLLADYGDCGKPVCCNNHLVKMPPVSMKMAKLQKASLDPTKISGRCGRLKCCLRYEFDTYLDIQRELPKVGAHIVTRNGKAKVIAQQIIAQQLLVETEDHRRILIEASEVLSVTRKGDSGDKAKINKNEARGERDRSGKSSGKTGGKSDSKSNPSERSDRKTPKAPAASKQEVEPNRKPQSAADGDRPDAQANESSSDQPKKKKRKRSRRPRKPKDPPAT